MPVAEQLTTWKIELARLCQPYTNSKVCFDIPLSKQTYFGIGGRASAYLEVGEIDLLVAVARFKNDYRLDTFILGRGSNLLVSDDGFDGLVIRLVGQLDWLTFEGTSVRAGAGVSQPKLSKAAARQGLSGVEFVLGIPGSVGGGLMMNAGAWGSCFSDLVTQIRVVTELGEVTEISADQAKFQYRQSCLNDYFCIIEAEMRLTESEINVVTQQMQQLYQQKMETQPCVVGSAGCMFKNPEGRSAGRSIDLCGLKGTRIGDAEVSQIHGNFIVNHGNASAKDVLDLVELIQLEVKKQQGIDLHLEVKLLGF